jgi:uncharacterized membrane protein YhaH (DUF805 family)
MQDSMTIQQWCFSFKGRIGRRDFWIWMVLWLLLMAVAFSLASRELVDIQTIAFFIVGLLWRNGCTTATKPAGGRCC